jgi:type IV secretory pathway VirB2 component (pilin)
MKKTRKIFPNLTSLLIGIFAFAFIILSLILSFNQLQTSAEENLLIANTTTTTSPTTTTTSGGSGNISRLNILGTTCLFPNQPGCEGEGNNLLDQVRLFLFGIGNAGAVVVIMYSGFKYFSSGIAGTEDGLKGIKAGVIGLILINGAQFLTSLIIGGENGGGLVTESGLNIARIENFLDILQNNVALPLASVVAVLVIIYGGYQYMFSALPEAKGNGIDTIKKGVIGLIVILLAAPIIDTVKETIKIQDGNAVVSVNPIVDFIRTFFINIMIPVSTVVSLFFIIWGGYKMIISQGDKTKYEEGISALKNAVIGVIVVLLSTTIVALITLFVPV